MAKPDPNDTRSVGKYEQEQKNTKGMKKMTPLMKHKEKNDSLMSTQMTTTKPGPNDTNVT